MDRKIEMLPHNSSPFDDAHFRPENDSTLFKASHQRSNLTLNDNDLFVFLLSLMGWAPIKPKIYLVSIGAGASS